MDAEDWKVASAQLDMHLDGSVVRSREQGGRQVSYIEGWHVIAEANRIFGFNNWTRETLQLTETNRDLLNIKGRNGDYQQWRVGYLCRVRINVDGVIRDGTGFGSGMSKPEALGDAIESAAKEAETDAMKRAFMTFGNQFGLALYDKSQSNVDRAEQPKEAPKPAAVQAKSREAAPPAGKPGDAFEALKESLGLIGHEKALDGWIEEVKAALRTGTISVSEKATLSTLLENKRGFLAQRSAA